MVEVILEIEIFSFESTLKLNEKISNNETRYIVSSP